jgi:hypothetical protein
MCNYYVTRTDSSYSKRLNLNGMIDASVSLVFLTILRERERGIVMLLSLNVPIRTDVSSQYDVSVAVKRSTSEVLIDKSNLIAMKKKMEEIQ